MCVCSVACPLTLREICSFSFLHLRRDSPLFFVCLFVLLSVLAVGTEGQLGDFWLHHSHGEEVQLWHLEESCPICSFCVFICSIFFLWLRPNFSSNEEKKIYCLSFLLMVESDFGVLPHVLTLYRREETGKHRLLKGGKAWKEVPITNTYIKDLFLPWSQDLVRKTERSIYNEEEEKQHQLDRGRAEKYL